MIFIHLRVQAQSGEEVKGRGLFFFGSLSDRRTKPSWLTAAALGMRPQGLNLRESGRWRSGPAALLSGLGLPVPVGASHCQVLGHLESG